MSIGMWCWKVSRLIRWETWSAIKKFMACWNLIIMQFMVCTISQNLEGLDCLLGFVQYCDALIPKHSFNLLQHVFKVPLSPFADYIPWSNVVIMRLPTKFTLLVAFNLKLSTMQLFLPISFIWMVTLTWLLCSNSGLKMILFLGGGRPFVKVFVCSVSLF